MSEPIQQQWMSRLFSEHAEIARGPSQGFTEVPLPYPVDDDTSGQRVVWMDHRLCQFAASAAIGKQRCIFAIHDLEEPAGGDFALFRQIASHRNMHVRCA